MKRFISVMLVLALVFCSTGMLTSLTFNAATNIISSDGETTYTYEPYTMDIYKKTSDSLVRNNTVTDENAITVAEGGVNNTYALKIIGDGKSHELSLCIGKYALPDTTKMTFSFSARVSSEQALTEFAIGTMNRWWKNISKSAEFSISKNNTGITDITTTWKSFTNTYYTSADSTKNYNLIYIKYNLPAGKILYLDNISIRSESNKEYFWQGSFEKASQSYSVLEKEPDDAYFTASYNEVESAVFAVSPAVSGKNVLALGFKDAAVNNRVWFGTPLVRPRGTYKLEMWVLVVGDVNRLKVTMGDNDPYANGTTVTEEMQAANPPESTVLFDYTGDVKNYLPRTWVKIEEIWTDTTTATDNYRWAGLNISINAPAGAGAFIDSVSITPLHECFGENAPNLFESMGFEYDYSLPDAEWNDTYTTNGDILDLSFMNSLPKTLGAMGDFKRSEFYDYFGFYQNPDFSHMGTAFLGSTNIELTVFQTLLALKTDREIWLDATTIVCANDTLIPNWKQRLDKVAYTVQSLAGDQFQGVYFDEPCYHFANNEQFIEVTKYIRENYKKRVFSMAAPGMLCLNDYYVKDDGTTFNVYVSSESHKYVTDFGVWRYSYDAGSVATKLVADAKKLDPNVRLWICGLMGRSAPTQTEDRNLTIISDMLEAVKTQPNFGGVLVWDLYSTNGYDILLPDENGVAEYNDFSELLKAVAKDFKAKDSWVYDKFNATATADNIIVLKDNIMSDNFINAFNTVLQDKITMLNNGNSTMGQTGLVNNPNVTVKIESLTTNAVTEYRFALANDVNCDNKVNALDIVRAKLIAAGKIAGNDLSFAAAGTDSQTGMSVSDIANVRAELMK